MVVAQNAILLDALHKVRAKIDKHQKWCAYWWESVDGRRLGLDGAIWSVAGWGTELANELFHCFCESALDVDSHREVMAMIDKAIESLGG